MPSQFPILLFLLSPPTTKFFIPPFWIQKSQHHQSSQIPKPRVNISWNSTLKDKSMKLVDPPTRDVSLLPPY